MKFQDSSFNGLKDTVDTKKGDAPTHAHTLQKQYAPPTFLVGGKLSLHDDIASFFKRVFSSPEPSCFGVRPSAVRCRQRPLLYLLRNR